MRPHQGFRLALMLHATTGMSDQEFAHALKMRRPGIDTLTQSIDAGLRVGTRHPDDYARDPETTWLESTAAAVELTIPEARLADLRAKVGQLAAPLADIADMERSIVMAGPMYQIVEPRGGDVFLSLAFNREPGTTPEELYDWWINHHAGLATGFLLPELQAYDQVHVDHELSERLSHDIGVAYRRFDAYDCLTWARHDEFLESVSKNPDAMAVMLQDEEGHLDKGTKVGAYMAIAE